jgi:DNA polymerase (family 10)
MDNRQISDIFLDIAKLLEMQGEDPFRIRAYYRAARTVERLHESLHTIARRQALQDIPDIGKTLAREITELLESGRLRYHDHLKSTVPEALLPVLRLPSLNVKQVRILWRTFDVTSMRHLAQVYKEGRLPFDESTLTRLGHDLTNWERDRQRMLLGMALPRAELLIQNLQQWPLVERISLAGSLRRGVDRVGDINLVMASSDPQRLIQVCTRQSEVRQVLTATSESATVITSEGLRVAFVAVPLASFETALLHYTGSAAHIAALRHLAQQRGLHLTEYALTQRRDANALPLSGEADIYHHLGLAEIPPELREHTGELDAAATGTLPRLVALEDIRGDLHIHSNWGNGAHGLQDIARAAQRLGYQYAAICDYTYAAETGQGLTPDELLKQTVAIRQLNAELPPSFRLLAGAEVEISPAGDLAFDEAVLHELDIVIAAMHTGTKAPRHQITRRLCKAMEHPLVNILAHPAGRMLGRQEVPNIDMEAILEAAVDTHTCLEINSHVLRLDLQDRYIRQAKDLGLMLALGSDAHSVQEMHTMRLGVHTARRGWLEAHQLLNALPYHELQRRLQERDATHAR